MRRRSAGLIASAQQSMSLKLARASPHTTAFLVRLAISLTAAKSPSEAIGKPASMTSTPIVSRSSATSSFSSCVIVAPGHCSPSRKVVSKMRTRSCSLLGALAFGAAAVALDLAGVLLELLLPLFMTRSLSMAPFRISHGAEFSARESVDRFLVALGFASGDPLSAKAQRPSRPSGGDKQQQPAEREGGAGAKRRLARRFARLRLAVDRAKIAADRHRQCLIAPSCAFRSSKLADRDEFRVNRLGRPM